jgi:hypothetical protein
LPLNHVPPLLGQLFFGEQIDESRVSWARAHQHPTPLAPDGFDGLRSVVVLPVPGRPWIDTSVAQHVADHQLALIQGRGW